MLSLPHPAGYPSARPTPDAGPQSSFSGTETSVPDMIGHYFRSTPDAAAIEYPGGSLTYAALDERAGRLAARLRQRLPQPGENICLYLPRSADLLVAILACWRAGHAYVPVPVGTPGGRVEHILDETESALLLTHRAYAPAVSHYRVPVLPLDGEDHLLAAGKITAPALPHPAAVAYIMYTSGSTGKPKGVVIEHTALAGYIGVARNRYVRVEAPVFPLFTSTGFDLTVTSLFTPLACGGRIVIYPEPPTGTPDLAVTQVLGDNRCDVVKLTPAHLALVSDGDYRRHRLGTLIVGGEQFPSTLARRLRSVLPEGTLIVNEYGPTEATVGCIVKEYTGQTGTATAVPIGHPIATAEAYLMDTAGQLVAPGQAGELYLGGSCLARGYWKQPRLTAERFVAHPFRMEDRLYRTGDRARYNADGELEFLGRNDRQVKWRGFRLELDEVEQLLASAPGVSAAAVELITDAADYPKLTAYYVAASPVTGEQLRDFLRRQLPAHSIPQALVELPALPLTSAGKIDRPALRALVVAVPAGRENFAAPVGEIEELLSELWAEVLEYSAVGRHDRFTDLGGHSLSALRLAARINEVLELEVPLSRIFLLPTVAQQAEYLEASLLQLLEASGDAK